MKLHHHSIFAVCWKRVLFLFLLLVFCMGSNDYITPWHEMTSPLKLKKSPFNIRLRKLITHAPNLSLGWSPYPRDEVTQRSLASAIPAFMREMEKKGSLSIEPFSNSFPRSFDLPGVLSLLKRQGKILLPSLEALFEYGDAGKRSSAYDAFEQMNSLSRPYIRSILQGKNLGHRKFFLGLSHLWSEGKQKKLRFLLSLLKTQTSWARVGTLQQLWKMAPLPTKTIPTFVALLPKIQRTEGQKTLLQILAHFGKKAKSATPFIKKLLYSEPNTLENQVLRALLKVSTPDWKVFSEVLKRCEYIQRKLATQIARKMHDSSPTFERALHRSYGVHTRCAVRLLSLVKGGKPHVVKKLQKELFGKGKKINLVYLEFLAENVPNHRTFRRLLWDRMHKLELTQERLQRFSKLGFLTPSRIKRLLQDRLSDRRYLAVRLLEYQRRKPWALPLLLGSFYDGNRIIYLSARRALKRIGISSPVVVYWIVYLFSELESYWSRMMPYDDSSGYWGLSSRYADLWRTLAKNAKASGPVIRHLLKKHGGNEWFLTAHCLGSKEKALPDLLQLLVEKRKEPHSKKTIQMVISAFRWMSFPALSRLRHTPELRLHARLFRLRMLAKNVSSADIQRKALHDKNPNIRRFAASNLRFYGKNLANVKSILRALKDKEPSVRTEAIETLGRIGGHFSLAVPALVSLLTTQRETASIKDKAYKALIRIGKPHSGLLPHLLHKIVHYHKEKQTDAAIQLLNKYSRKSKNNVSTVLKYIRRQKGKLSPLILWLDLVPKDTSGRITFFLLKALEHQPKNQQASIVKVLCRRKEHPEIVVPDMVRAWKKKSGRKAILGVLSCYRNNTKEVRDLLFRIVQEEKGPIAILAAKTLGTMGDAVLPMLYKALRKSSGEKKRRLLTAIKHAGNPHAAAALLFSKYLSKGDAQALKVSKILIDTTDQQTRITKGLRLLLRDLAHPAPKRWRELALRETNKAFRGEKIKTKQDLSVYQISLHNNLQRHRDEIMRGIVHILSRTGPHKAPMLRALGKVLVRKLKSSTSDNSLYITLPLAKTLVRGSQMHPGLAVQILSEIHIKGHFKRKLLAPILGMMGVRGIPVLKKLFHHPNWRIKLLAAQAIGAIEKPAIPSLLSLLKHKTPNIRYLAARSLGYMEEKGKASLSSLISTLADKEKWIARMAALAIGRIGHIAEKVLRSHTQNPNAQIRGYAIWALGLIRPRKPNRIPLYLRAMHDKDRHVRDMAKRALYMSLPVAHHKIDVLIRALSSAQQSPKADIAFLFLFLYPHSRRAVPVFLDLLTHTSKKVRQVASQVLMNIATPLPKDIPTLIKAFQHREPSVRKHAKLFLRRLGPLAVTHVISLMKTKNPVLLLRTLRLLAHFDIQAVGAIPILTQLLESSVPEVRRRSLHLLSRLRPFSFSVQSTIAKMLDDPSPSNRGVAISFLSKLKKVPPQLYTRIIGEFKHSSPKVRAAVVASIGVMGSRNTQSLQILQKGLQDPDKKVSTASALSFCFLQLGDAQRESILSQLLGNFPKAKGQARREVAKAILCLLTSKEGRNLIRQKKATKLLHSLFGLFKTGAKDADIWVRYFLSEAHFLCVNVLFKNTRHKHPHIRREAKQLLKKLGAKHPSIRKRLKYLRKSPFWQAR